MAFPKVQLCQNYSIMTDAKIGFFNQFDTIEFILPSSLVTINDDCFTYRNDKEINKNRCVNWGYKRIKGTSIGDGINFISVGRGKTKIKVSSKLIDGQLIDCNFFEKLIDTLNKSWVVSVKSSDLWEFGKVGICHVAKDCKFPNIYNTLESLALIQLNKTWYVQQFPNKSISLNPKGRDKRAKPDGNIYCKFTESKNDQFKNIIRTEFKTKTATKLCSLLDIPNTKVKTVFEAKTNGIHNLMTNIVEQSNLINLNSKMKPETQLAFKFIFNECNGDIDHCLKYLNTMYKDRTLTRKRGMFKEWVLSMNSPKIPVIDDYLNRLEY